MWQVGVAALLLPCHTITGNLLPDEAVAEVLEQVEDSQAGVVVGVLSIVVTVTIIVSTLGGCRHPEPLRAEAAAGGRGHQLRHVLQQQRAAAHPRARRRLHARHREGQLGVKTTLWTL